MEFMSTSETIWKYEPRVGSYQNQSS